MSRKIIIAAIALPLLFAATVLALPDGQPDIAGTWNAKVKGKGFATDPAEDDEKFKVGLDFQFSQMGSSLTMTVLVPGEAPFDMTGEIGNGHFWVAGETEGSRPRLAVGHVAKNGKKLKGMLLEAWNDEVTEVKFTAKRPK